MGSITKVAALLCFITTVTMAQEQLVQNEFEKGYIKDGQRISVWQYFDLARKPELIINYASGKVMFLSKDTSDYFILKNSQWVASKLDVHPVPITGSVNFYNDVKNKIIYPQKDFEAGLEGKVIVLFEVDTLGNSINYLVGKSIGGACDSAVVRCLRSIDQKWIPAVSKGKKYHAQFAVDVEFRLNERVAPLEHEEYELRKAKLLTSIIVAKDEKVFNFVEKSADFVGGTEALYKYISKNLQYPPSARRLGIEGTVTTKFIIEPDGLITNAEILKGVDGACDKEALRLIRSMPRWKPGTQGGRAIRQAYVLPVKFRLSE